MSNESPQSSGDRGDVNRDVNSSDNSTNSRGDSHSILDEQRFYSENGSRSEREIPAGVPIDERARLKAKSWVDVALKQQLPLQTETSFFILVNVLDFFFTFMLLNFGAIESNPLADFFYKNFGFRGMLVFKLVSVAVICLLAQVIAKKSMAHARFVLVGGSFIVGAVVIYSAWLLRGLIS